MVLGHPRLILSLFLSHVGRTIVDLSHVTAKVCVWDGGGSRFVFLIDWVS